MSNNKSNSNINNLIASSCATTCAEILTLPICTIKTNYQTNYQTNYHKGGIIKTVKNIYQIRGLKGFYSASIPAISAQVISTAGKYTLYRVGTSNNFPKVLSGIGAGIIVSTITHPFDFLRISLQRDDPIVWESIYRGYSKTLIKVTIGSSLYLPIYDIIKSYIDNVFVASLTSAIISTTLIQPFDYIKTRNIAGLNWYQGSNPLIYFRGCSLNLLRVVPHFITVMCLTELLTRN